MEVKNLKCFLAPRPSRKSSQPYRRPASEQRKFITWTFFFSYSCLLPLFSHIQEKQSWGSGPLERPLQALYCFKAEVILLRGVVETKGRGFIAGSTVWKETHSNIVWFSEIVDRHPRCFLWMVYEQISRMEAGCVWAEGLVVGGFFGEIFSVQTASCPRALRPRCRPWQSTHVGMSSPFSLTRWRGGEEEGWVKGSWSQNHTGGGVMSVFGSFLARILSSDPSLSAAMFMDILK